MEFIELGVGPVGLSFSLFADKFASHGLKIQVYLFQYLSTPQHISV